jgi:hypothetical protein
MKMTEKGIRALVSAANAASKTKGCEVGLEYERRNAGHYVGIKYRANGFVHASFDAMTASEAAVAVQLFKYMMEV